MGSRWARLNLERCRPALTKTVMTTIEQSPALFTPGTEGIWHGLPESVYHAAPGIGQSMLKAFDAEPTPAHYMESLSRERAVTEDMEFGTILHTAILQPELLNKAYYVRPERYPTAKGDKPWHGGADFCKEWEKEHSDRPVIDAAKEARIPKIMQTVNSLPIAGQILSFGQKEVSFFKTDTETGLLLKARVDAIATARDGATHLLDLKKVRRAYAREERFGVICADLGYDIQCASYLSITGATRFIFVAMEDEAPFEAEMFELDPEDHARGLAKWRKILLRYAEVMNSDEWPGYTRTVKRLKLPKWASRERMEAEAVYS